MTRVLGRPSGRCVIAGRRGLEVDCALDLAYAQGRASTRPTAELESAIYRISRKALTNAAKYGPAQRAVVKTAESQTTVEWTVRDDGAGCDPNRGPAGFGLSGMRERVGLIGETVRVRSAVDEGTRVTARFSAQRRPADTSAAPALLVPAAATS